MKLGTLGKNEALTELYLQPCHIFVCIVVLFMLYLFVFGFVFHFETSFSNLPALMQNFLFIPGRHQNCKCPVYQIPRIKGLHH